MTDKKIEEKDPKQEKAKEFYEKYDALRKEYGLEIGAQTTLQIVEFNPQNQTT